MNPAPTCATCRHHAGTPDDAGRRQCRRLAPQFARELHDGGEYAFFARWPITRPEDFCGQHEPRPEPEPEPADEPAETPADGDQPDDHADDHADGEPEPEPDEAPAGPGPDLARAGRRRGARRHR